MAKGSKRGLYAASTTTEQKYWRDQCAGQWRSGTHGIGYGTEEDIDTQRNTEVVRRKRLLLLWQAKRRACCAGLPTEKEARGKRDGSLVLTIGANEAEKEDGGQKSAVQRDSEYVGQLLTEATAVEKQKQGTYGYRCAGY